MVDIRSLEPFDADTVIKSVEKTGRAVVAHEANVKGGFGAEIASTIQERAFDSLKAPVQRVGAPNVPVPFHRFLNRHTFQIMKILSQQQESVCKSLQ